MWREAMKEKPGPKSGDNITGSRVTGTSRAYTLSEVAKGAGLSSDEVRRYNPALVKRVPAHADLYLPRYVKRFGPDVTFWHRPANAAFAAALDDFLSLDATPEQWDDGTLVPVLRRFEKRFRDSKSEEGSVMATVLAFSIDDALSSGRREILAAFRADDDVRQLFDRGLLQRVSANLTLLSCTPEATAKDPDRSSC